MLRAFVEKEVEPQAFEFNKQEEFNLELFQKLGTLTSDGLGILGLTVSGKSEEKTTVGAARSNHPSYLCLFSQLQKHTLGRISTQAQ